MGIAKFYYSDNKPLGIKSLMLIVATLLSSCSTYLWQMYPGSKRPSTEVALLRSFKPTNIEYVDGKLGPSGKIIGYSSKSTGHGAVEFQPGYHEITVTRVTYKGHGPVTQDIYGRYQSKHFYAVDSKNYSFVFEPGRVYLVKWSDGIIDITANANQYRRLGGRFRLDLNGK